MPLTENQKKYIFYGSIALVFILLGILVASLFNNVNVPNIVGLDKQDAANLLEKNNLEYNFNEILLQPDDKNIGKVISQDPLANKKVPKKTLVNINLGVDNSSQPPLNSKITVPNFVKTNINDAFQKASGSKLVLEVSKTLLPQGDPNIDLVLSQIPIAGSTVDENSIIKVEIGVLNPGALPNGGVNVGQVGGAGGVNVGQVGGGVVAQPQMIIVPNLIGKTWQDANVITTNLQLNLVRGLDIPTQNPNEIGRIVQQLPLVGNQILQFQGIVKVQIGSQPGGQQPGGQQPGAQQPGGQQPGGQQIIPDIVNKTVRDANALLRPLGLSIGASPLVCSNDANLNNKIASQNPAAGLPIGNAIGGKINITIYSNARNACNAPGGGQPGAQQPGPQQPGPQQGGQELRLVPNVVGNTVPQAFNSLTNMQLRVNIIRQNTSGNIAQNTVWKQDPQANSQVPINSTVNIYAPEIVRQLRPVPNIVGKSLIEATEMIARNQLQSRPIFRTRPNPPLGAERRPGYVYHQVQQPNTELAIQSLVTFFVNPQ